MDSYSSLKVFLEDRKKYYKKFVLKEPQKEEESDELRLGSLVDCLLFTPDDYESRFALSVTAIPSGQYGKLVAALWQETLGATNEEGTVTLSLDTLLEAAYNSVKFDKDGNVVDFKRDSLETAKEKFVRDEAGIRTYYQQLRESYGKTIIELSELEKAQAIVMELRANRVTKTVINQVTDEDFTVYNQFPIVGKLDKSVTKLAEDYPLKCLIDKLVIDRKKKSIYIFDLKTAWDNEQQFQYNYFKYKYYLQMAVYFYLVVEWKKVTPGLEDYEVVLPRFIVADSNNYKNPLVYTTNMANLMQGMKGFTINGRYYPGVIKAVQDLIWHKENTIWNISRDNHETSGVVKIKPFETDELYK